MRWVVAVDLNHSAEALMQQAADWAVRTKAVLDLLYVDDTPLAAAYIQDPVVRELVAKEQHHLAAVHATRAQSLMALVPTDHRGTVRCLEGRPSEVIVEQGAMADGIMIGTHGRTGLAHLWLGSVAERVVRASHVPVLVLRVPRG